MFRTLLPAILVLLSGCASGGMRIEPGREFTLVPGAGATLPDASALRYLGIANDSRCPPRVQCIRAGDADVLFDLVPAGGAPARILLNTERMRSATARRWTLQLVGLASGEKPGATLRLTTGDLP